MKNKPSIPEDMSIGSIRESKNYGKYEIYKYIRSSEVYIKFLDTGHISKTSTGKIRMGYLKDPIRPSVYGVGFIGVPEKGTPTNRTSYAKWCSMMYRCYGDYSKVENPSYEECSVCKEWHNYQNFARWYDANNNDDDTIKWELDKDLTIIGNKLYSPESCMLVPKNVNLFIVSRDGDRGEFMIGVSWNKEKRKFRTQCNDPMTSKNRHVGYFNTEISAHLAWRKAKSMHAEQLASDQVYDNVKNAILRYKAAIDNNLIHCY